MVERDAWRGLDRGAAPQARITFEDTLVRVSYLAMHVQGHLAELDINPLMLLPRGQGVKAADALVLPRGTQHCPWLRAWPKGLHGLIVGSSDRFGAHIALYCAGAIMTD